MSKFDFDGFTGDYPVAVSKERYTEQEAIEIAKRELGEEKVTVFDGYVRFGFGTDPDDPCAKPRNAWWLDIGKNYPKGCCPVWAFCKVRMTLELKQYKSPFFSNSTEPYRLGGVKSITNNTFYGEGHFAITIFGTKVFVTSAFEYVKDVDSGKMFVRNGKWEG